MRALQRFVEVHADFGQTQENPDHGSRRIQSRLVHISIKTQSKLDRNSNEDRSEFELSFCRIRVALRKISKGFKRVLDKIWARFSP